MATDSVFCVECGARNETDAVFCESCGQPLEQRSSPVPNGAAIAPASARRRFSPWLVTLVGVVVLTGAAALAFPAERAMLTQGLRDLAGRTNSMSATSQRALDSLNLEALDSSAVLLHDRPVESQEIVVQRGESSTPPAPPLGTRRDPSPPPIPHNELAPPDLSLLVPSGAVSSATTRRDADVAIATLRDAARTSRPGNAALSMNIPAGTVLTLRSLDQVCTDKNSVGDEFQATLQHDIVGVNGARVPKGSVVTFAVDRLRRSNSNTEPTDFSVAPQSIQWNGDEFVLAARVDMITFRRKGNGSVSGVIGQLGNGDGCLEQNALLRLTLVAAIVMR